MHNSKRFSPELGDGTATKVDSTPPDIDEYWECWQRHDPMSDPKFVEIYEKGVIPKVQPEPDEPTIKN